jgi:type II secretory ATPase GspE/PulE/Tfp pilus assembly ATPase PilB-like protein/8-oxo-dGTP pyrophosphatase MutT (NUDIX family)
VSLVAERWARQFRVVPLSASDQEIVVGSADPLDFDCERTLAFATGRRVRFAVAAPDAIERRLEELYGGVFQDDGSQPAPESLVDVQHLTTDAEAAPPIALDDTSASATQLVDELLAAGIAARASDIHIEPDERGITIRHRVDGVLAPARVLPRSVAPALVSRIKILSGLDIADRLRPQDGRARVAVSGVAVDLRVSTLPASHGEKVVIRVLDGRSAVMTLDGMGFHADELARIDQLLALREGLVLVTGPTGSGKTTTLYAALRQIKEHGVNVVTVEDPIEYRLPGIVQVQVNERAGLTFASALRSIMRQDPDVLLIGEIRDAETAEIAIQASLTGDLVLSTLHTNDAPSAITRLSDIGVASYKIATAVKGVLAQRLVRRLCPRCGGRDATTCRVCGGTGFRGRLALVEVIIGSPEFARAIANGATADRLTTIAREQGMRSLWGAGVTHVRAGRTTLAEVQRVASPTSADVEALAARPSPSSPPVEMVREPWPSAITGQQRSAPLLRNAAATVDGIVGPDSFRAMAELRVGTVDVYVIAPAARVDDWRVLVLQRSQGTRCPGSWETVHGHIEPGEEPEDAAVRELREETGLSVERLYNVTVQSFYLHKTHQLMLAVVFAAFVQPDAIITGPEHQAAEWLRVDEARARFQWPRERMALDEITELLATGNAGAAEDVMRVR